jgi:uncharacterized protein (DUF1697 family)
MARYVAFLRAINVGGHVVKMDLLRATFEDLGFGSVETFIASGNVIFETRSKDRAGMEGRIERALEDTLGYEVATFIRTVSEVAAIASHQAFPPPATESAAALNVGMLKAPLPEGTEIALRKLRTDVDDFRVNGSELYWICLKRQSESKISNAVFERTLKVKATFRGLRTLEKLAAKYPA